MSSDRDEIELIGPDSGDDQPQDPISSVSKPGDRRALAILAVLALVAIGFLLLSGDDPVSDPERDGPTADENSPDGAAGTTASLPDSGSERLDAVQIAQGIPPPLLAAEVFTAAPSADGLRDLLEALGGFENLRIASAEGAFDLVRFDPRDSNRLLASRRLSYGEAENQLINEFWTVTSTGEVEQMTWQPSVDHDFAHFNIDGTATMWVHGGQPGFAPRVAVALDRDFNPLARAEPIYASRFTSVGGTVFALTGNGDYYTNDDGYVSLVADDGTGVQILDDGARYAWIDNPTPDLLLAYPTDRNGSVSAWNASTLEPLPNHPLAGRAYRRAAINAAQTVAVGATFDGELDVIDLTTGVAKGAFGRVEVDGVDQPITLSDDGTIAVTVENSGRVSMWWVGDDTPLLTVVADERQPRWVSAEYAPRSTSVVSADASRVALLTLARADTPTSWAIIDADVGSWVRRACVEAARALTDREIAGLGLPDQPRACPDQPTGETN